MNYFKILGVCVLALSIAGCTTTRKAAKPVVETPPVVDQDGDGILDVDDRCPKEAETLNGYRDADGCPDVIPPRPVIQSIHYGVNTKDITKESIGILVEAAETLKRYPGLNIRIEGHTDSYGAPSYNLEISKRRADAVKNWLVREYGIEPARIQTEGYGMSRPIDSFNTREGRIANRRIDFVIVEGWPPKE